MNKLNSAVASYTPMNPLTAEQAEAVRSRIEGGLHKIAAEVDDYLKSLPEAESAARGEPPEEEVIIITSPPP